MDWNAIGAIGEILGATAVLITLGYLAVQIRQNTQAVRASALDSSVTSIMTVRGSIAESAELSAIFDKGIADPESLNELEGTRFRFLMQNVMWGFWNVHAQSGYANLSTSVWEAQLPIVARVMTSPGGRWFWESFRHEFEASFRVEVDTIVDRAT